MASGEGEAATTAPSLWGQSVVLRGAFTQAGSGLGSTGARGEGGGKEQGGGKETLTLRGGSPSPRIDSHGVRVSCGGGTCPGRRHTLRPTPAEDPTEGQPSSESAQRRPASPAAGVCVRANPPAVPPQLGDRREGDACGRRARRRGRRRRTPAAPGRGASSSLASAQTHGHLARVKSGIYVANAKAVCWQLGIANASRSY